MSKVLVCIMAGLGTRYSDGIGVKLKNELEQIPRVDVLSGSYSEGEEYIDIIRATPLETDIIIVGHSLGGSYAPEVARRTLRPIAAIFGFDPADNWAANVGRYKLTRVPANVHLARAGIAEITGLGGGRYEAENPDKTVIENIIVKGTNHLTVDDVLRERLTIGVFVRRTVNA